MSQKRVLLVEDDTDQRELLTTFLQSKSFHVIQAVNGEEALAKASSQPVDIVITDLALPKINGAELAASLQSSAKTAQLPVILMTAGSELVPFTDIQFKAAGFILKKDIKVLPEKINSILNG